MHPMMPTSRCGLRFRISEKPCTRPRTRCSAFSRTEQVFTKMISASFLSFTCSNPRALRMAATTSLSATFIWQPYVSI